MLYTISWMVAREPEDAREGLWDGILVYFLVGGVVGGAVIGGVIAFPARVLFDFIGPQPVAFLAAAAAVAAAYAGRAANLWPLPKPQFPHQVPEAWRNIFSAKVASFSYATGLGTIYFTRLASLTAYPLVLLLLGMGGTPLAIIEIMAAVGLVRASTALVTPVLRLDSVGSEAVLALMRKYSAAVRIGELFVLLCLASLPLASVLV